MEGRRGHLQFHTLSRRFVYRWYLTMQGTKTWPKESKYRRRSQKLYSINYGQDGHVCKTNLRTFIHAFYTLPLWCVFLKHKIQCWPFFLHRLNGNIFWVYRQYTWYLKIERYGSLVVSLNDFAWRHYVHLTRYVQLGKGYCLRSFLFICFTSYKRSGQHKTKKYQIIVICV